MADRQPESKEFPVERAVFELPGGQLATEKGERLPGTIDLLFVHRADGVARRGGGGDGGIMRRMGQHGGLAQGGLRGLERLLPLRRPVDSLVRGLVLESPVQWAHEVSRLADEPVVKRHHPQEFPERPSRVWAGESRNCLHLRRKRGGPLFVDEMPQEVDGGQPEQALRRVDD